MVLFSFPAGQLLRQLSKCLEQKTEVPASASTPTLTRGPLACDWAIYISLLYRQISQFMNYEPRSFLLFIFLSHCHS